MGDKHWHYFDDVKSASCDPVPIVWILVVPTGWIYSRFFLIKYCQLVFVICKGQQWVSLTDWPLKQYKDINGDLGILLSLYSNGFLNCSSFSQNSVMHFMIFLRALLRKIILPEILIYSCVNTHLTFFTRSNIFSWQDLQLTFEELLLYWQTYLFYWGTYDGCSLTDRLWWQWYGIDKILF